MALKLGELVAIIRADDSQFRKTLRSVKTGLEGVGKFAGFGALAGSALTFAAALAPAVGIVAAAPAAFAALKVASFALQMALEGVGDTLGAALVGDAKKFEEALKELPPSARAVVAELGAALGGLQKRVQESAFAPMRREARGLGDDLRGPIQGGMSAVGAALGRVGARLLEVTREARTIRVLRGLFAGVADGIDGAGRGLPDLVRGVRDLVGAFTGDIGRAGTALGGLMSRVGRWLSQIATSGQATRWVDNAVATLQQLGHIVTNLGVGLGAIFSQAGAGAGDLLGSLEQITSRFAEWAQSAEGQQAAANVFGTLNQTASELAAVLPLLAGPLGLIVDLLEALPGGEGTVAQFLAWSIAAGLITSKLAPLATGLGKVGGAAVDLGGKLKRSEALRSFGSRLAGMASSAGRWATNLAASAGRAAASFAASAARMTVSAVMTGARVAGTWAMMAARAMLAAVRMAASWVIAMGPVGWAIAAVVGAVALIIANWDRVKRFITETLPRALRRGFDFMVGLIRNAAKFGFLGPIPLIIAHWKKISSFFTETLPQAVRRGIDNSVEWARGLPGRILDAIGTVGSLLYNTGRNIVIGLWNGLVGMGRWLYDQLWRWVRAVIPDPIERFLGIASPSKLFATYGKNLAEGLALGMDDSAHLVARASHRLAGAADAGMRVPRTDLLGTVPGSSSRSAGRGAGRTEVIVRFESDDADLLRRIRRHVRIKGGGNVQLAFGTTLRGVRT